MDGSTPTQSGINVTFEPQPEFDTALQAALAAGDPPDIFYVDSLRLPDLADAGALAPIPEGAITEPDDIYPSLTEAFTYDGTWYCPPKDFSTLGLVYNADMLEAAGVEPPTNMEELAAAAEALTTDGVVGLSFGAELARVGVFMLANGGYIVNEDVSEMTLDTEENRAALQYLADMFAAGHAATPAAVEAGWGGEALRSRQGRDGHRGQLARRCHGPGLPRRQLGRRRASRRTRRPGDLRLHGLLRRRRRVAEPGRVLAGDRLPHRSGGCGGVDRRRST